MAKIIDLPDGSEVEFPDSMSDADIKSVLSKKFPAPKAKENSLLGETGRQLGLTGRYALEGAAALPAALGNVLEKVGVKGAGGNAGTRAADYLGLPKAEREGEKIVSDITQTLVPGAGAYKGVEKVVGAGPGLVRAVARNVGGGAAAGAAGNAALDQDIGEGAAYGAVLGPVGAGAGKVLQKGYELGGRAFGGAANEATHVMRERLGSRTDAAIAALRNTKGNVAGEMPTAGRAASAEFPEFKILEEAARSKPGAERYLMRDKQNEAARLAAVERYAAGGREGVAAGPGAPVPKSPLEQARADRSGPKYERSMEDRIILNPELDAILGGQQIQPAARQGAVRFGQEQTNAFAGGRPVPGGATQTRGGSGVRSSSSVSNSGVGPLGEAIEIPQVRGPLGEAVTPVPVPREVSVPIQRFAGDPTTDALMRPIQPSRSIADLQILRTRLDDQLESAVRKGDMADVRRLREARTQLSQQMEAQSPAFAEANATHRQMSAPVNQSKVAGVLADALRNSKGAEQSGAFLSAMENAPKTIKNADLSPRFKQLEQVATVGQLRDYNKVRSSLQREADYANLKTPEGILPKYMSPADVTESALPGWFSRPITLARAGLKKLGKQTDEQVFKVLNDAMLDPNKMADLLEKIPARQRSEFLNLLNSAPVRGATTGATVPTEE